MYGGRAGSRGVNDSQASRTPCRRALLFDMDVAIQRLGAEHALHPSVVSLTGIYHNVLRE